MWSMRYSEGTLPSPRSVSKFGIVMVGKGEEKAKII